VPRLREEGAGGGLDQVAGAQRVIRPVMSRVSGLGGRNGAGLVDTLGAAPNLGLAGRI
jgi:hypothetical protein